MWRLAEDDELDRVPLAAAVECFFGLAVLELAVLEPAVFDLAVAFPLAGFAVVVPFAVVLFAFLAFVLLCVFESEADACPSARETQKHVNAKAQNARNHLRILA